jgi:hypothetical protein
VTTGEYTPVISGLSPADILRPLGFEQIAGNQANGIRIFRSFEDYRQYMDWCNFDPQDTRWSDLLKFQWLPPGTEAITPQSAMLCPGGALSVVSVDFEAGLSELSVTSWAGRRALLTEDEVVGLFAGTISGRSAIVAVGVPDGFPHTQVVIATDKGSIDLDTRFVPLEDVLAFAGGIGCHDC